MIRIPVRYFSILTGVLLMAGLAAAQSPAKTLDLVGIRPGMQAQDAYNLLKARSTNGVAVGEAPLDGFGQKPVPTSMTGTVLSSGANDVLIAWLTIPPGKQVVYAVGRSITQPNNQPLLKSAVLDSLRRKYGPETSTDSNIYYYWAFDENGKPMDKNVVKQHGCGVGRPNMPIQAPQGTTYSSATELISAPPAVATPCDASIGVYVNFTNDNVRGSDYVGFLEVRLIDFGLERRSQASYQTFLKHGAVARDNAERDKAKQRKVPTF